MAKLYFRYGAMNSGKSTALMQVAHNYEEQGMQVLILKPQVDTKGGDELVSRLGVRRKADLLIPPQLNVFDAVQKAAALGAKIACGSDAGAYRVLHGQGGLDERTLLRRAIGEGADTVTDAGNAVIMARF